MTNSNDARPEHPEELLAGYVDGSASPEERRLVEAHLAGCARCRDEVALASAGRTALMSLPQLNAPGLSPQVTAGLARESSPPPGGSDDLAQRRQKEGRQPRRWQTSWVAAAGVAAVVALVAVIPFALSRTGGGGGASVSGAARSPEARPAPKSYPSVYDLGSNYDPASLRSLAKELGPKVGRFKAAEPTGAAVAPSPSPVTPDSAVRIASGVTSSDVVECALRGTGLPGNTIPVYLEKAQYQGKPAYVIAVVAQGEKRAHLRVYAVSQQGCQFLFEADQPL